MEVFISDLIEERKREANMSRICAGSISRTNDDGDGDKDPNKDRDRDQDKGIRDQHNNK